MQSIRSRWLIFLLKHKHWLELKSRKDNEIHRIEDIIPFRENVEKGAERFGRLPKGIEVENTQVADINAYWIRKRGNPANKVILYFHGGGLVAGSAKSHRNIVANVVNESGVDACVFDYSLAPEKPFPHALNDADRVYNGLLNLGHQPANILLMGDSGGGNLVFSLMLTLKKKETALPVAAVALSPWTDLTNSGPSNRENLKRDPLTPKGSNDVFSKAYCNGHDPKDPFVSPLFGDLKGLPPIMLFAGGNEVMRDDSTRFASCAKAAGVEVEITIGEGLFHCYPACSPMFPEAKQAMKQMVGFNRKKLDIAPGSPSNSNGFKALRAERV